MQARLGGVVAAIPHPQWDLFLAGLGEEREWGQVVVRRMGGGAGGFELRHVLDRKAEAGGLRRIPVERLREIRRVTADGRYRPLTGAPNLRSGWICVVVGASDLVLALHHLYPGSLGDAWAAEHADSSGIPFEAVAGKQLGKAKVLNQLRGGKLAAVIEAACSPRACLKHRRWSAEGVAADDAGLKSSIPCLEPCPFLLGFARTCAEIEQRVTVAVEFAPDDLATLAAALRHALEHPPGGLREGEVADPLHPGRVARVLARYPVIGSAVVDRLSTPDE